MYFLGAKTTQSKTISVNTWQKLEGHSHGITESPYIICQW